MLADVEMNDSFVTQFGDRWEPFYHFTSQPGVMSACFVVVTKVILAKALKTRVRFFLSDPSQVQSLPDFSLSHDNDT